MSGRGGEEGEGEGRGGGGGGGKERGIEERAWKRETIGQEYAAG